MAESSKAEKALVKKVSELRPLDTGLTITVKVVDTKVIAPRGRQGRTTESLVGDASGMIILISRNDQVDLVKEGNTLILRNARVEMLRGSMRLAVDRNGSIEVTDPASFTVDEDCNLSLIEFEVVNVVG